jgi:adenylate cyclase
VVLRVVFAEDNYLVREGTAALLAGVEELELVESVSDLASLLEAVEKHKPDAVLTDIRMPPSHSTEGIEGAKRIRAEHPDIGVVVLSAHDDEAYALALLGGGESGLAYLLKDRLGQGDELARAIREVAQGGSMVDPTIAARLSGREEGEEDRQILDLMAKGMGYAEMAEKLGTTQEAIDSQVTELFQRLAAEAGRGASHAVDQLKRLHSAVVESSTSVRTLRSYVPAQFAERLEAGGGAPIQQEEVEVTILFSDIRGFSTLAEQMSAREVASILAKHLSAMAEVVLGHGGTIDKFAGDGVMAIFGAPDPQPDHPARALRCALDMQARQQQLNWETTQAEGVLPLGMGIGVNTGIVVAGTFGGAGRLEYTVMGDAVNLAQRLQSEAVAGEILASASTAKAAPDVTSEPVGLKQVKGRKEAVETFRILIPEQPEG